MILGVFYQRTTGLHFKMLRSTLHTKIETLRATRSGEKTEPFRALQRAIFSISKKSILKALVIRGLTFLDESPWDQSTERSRNNYKRLASPLSPNNCPPPPPSLSLLPPSTRKLCMAIASLFAVFCNYLSPVQHSILTRFFYRHTVNILNIKY